MDVVAEAECRGGEGGDAADGEGGDSATGDSRAVTRHTV